MPFPWSSISVVIHPSEFLILISTLDPSGEYLMALCVRFVKTCRILFLSTMTSQLSTA